jgi:hypothetical protein
MVFGREFGNCRQYPEGTRSEGGPEESLRTSPLERPRMLVWGVKYWPLIAANIFVVLALRSCRQRCLLSGSEVYVSSVEGHHG